MNNNIQCSIESSTTKIELNSAVDGVFLVPELEGLVGLPEIRTTSGVNAGYDGGWTSAQNYDARLISIRGVIANPDISKVEDKRRAIASLLGQGRKEQLTLRFTTEAGNAYAISVRTISCEMALQRVLTTQEFLIQLRADDPLIYDDGTTGGIAAILQPQRALGGFEINFGLPLAIGGGAEDTVVDNGNETVYPVIKLYGALHSPTVVNRTTNQQMQILADLQYSIDWHTYRSATGDYILVNDGLDGAPMTLSQLTGNATQTTYSGKNLFSGDFAQFDNQGGEGTTYAYFKLPTDGDYALSVKAKNDVPIQNDVSIGFSRHGGNASDGYKWVYQSKSMSMTKGETRAMNNTYSGSKLGFIFMYPKTANVLKFLTDNFEIQLEASSTATTWEKYVGGTPAPNPEFPMPISVVTGENVVKIEGKNLLQIPDSTNTSAGVTFTASNGTLTASGTTTRVSHAENYSIFPTLATYGNYPNYANITEANSIELPAGTYTASAEITKTGETLAGVAFCTGATMGARVTGVTKLEVLFNDATGTYTKTATFTIAEGERLYVSTYYEGGSTKKNVGFTISNIQLELGSTATAYEPYQGQEYTIDLDTIELAKIGNYQDRIYKEDSKWYIEKQIGKVVLDGTNTDITWSRTAVDGDYAFWFRSFTIGALQEKHTKLCDKFTYTITAYNQGAPTPSLCENDVTSTASFMFIFKVPSSLATTITEWTTWLSTHNTTVYYALATPTTTEITDETLLLQLNFLASLYEGENNISLVGTGAQGEMAISYATDCTVNQDVITIDSQARTITLNGQDVYHLKTSESEFLVLAPGENKLYLTSEVSDDSGYAEVKFKQGYLSI